MQDMILYAIGQSCTGKPLVFIMFSEPTVTNNHYGDVIPIPSKNLPKICADFVARQGGADAACQQGKQGGTGKKAGRPQGGFCEAKVLKVPTQDCGKRPQSLGRFLLGIGIKS